jgi:hypothetical protein
VDYTQACFINLWVVDGYSNTHCYFQLIVSKNMLAKLLQAAVGKFLGSMDGSTRQQDCKFVSTISSSDVTGSQVIADQLSHFLQDKISGEMTIGIINVFEVIEVHHSHAQGPTISISLLAGLYEPILENPTNKQSSYAVVTTDSQAFRMNS